VSKPLAVVVLFCIAGFIGVFIAAWVITSLH
jgi:hypothetical protein